MGLAFSSNEGKCIYAVQKNMPKRLDEYLKKYKVDPNVLMIEFASQGYLNSSRDYGPRIFWFCSPLMRPFLLFSFGRKVPSLHFAALQGFVDVSRVLIQNGAVVDARHKWAPIHFAVYEGHVDVVNLLIRHGARTDLRCNSRKFTLLQIATLQNHYEVAKCLIQNGADVNAVNKAGWTALHYAALLGHVDIAKLLLQNGADVDATDDRYDRLNNLVSLSLSHRHSQTPTGTLPHFMLRLTWDAQIL